MIHIKSKVEIRLMAKSGHVAAFALKEILKDIKPGIATKDLDSKARRLIEARNATPAFLGHEGYEFSICVSINDEVVHGLPSKRKIKIGDIVKIDLGAKLDGYYSDTAGTVLVSSKDERLSELRDGTKEALRQAIILCKEGNRLGDIEAKIGEILRKYRLSPVMSLTGHGIGRNLHEDPRVRCDGKEGTGEILKEGMVLAIEPMATLGTGTVKVSDDGWTIKTADKSSAAHFEHTVLVTKTGGKVLTSIS